jgi:hypothetical protein
VRVVNVRTVSSRSIHHNIPDLVWDCAHFVLTLTVIGLHDVVDALQDAIDPRRIRASSSNG